MLLKFAIRNLIKRPFPNLIKIVGLSLALSGILLIALFLEHELGFDGFHEKAHRIYRYSVSNKNDGRHFARLYQPNYIPEMANYFPEVENYARLVPMRGGVLKIDERYINLAQGFVCDSTFFDVFCAELVVGDAKNVLKYPASMVITESFAKKTFGDLNPIGQVLTRPKGQYYGEDIDYTVQGIMKNFPENSHFHPELVTTPRDKSAFEGWAWTYLLLGENADPAKIFSQFNDFYCGHSGKSAEEIDFEPHLQKITDIHLHSHKLREIEANSNMTIVYTLSVAALVLLFIAFVNYANLNIGMAGYSSKYLFVGKVVGAPKWLGMRYFLCEGFIIGTISIAMSLLITGLAHSTIQRNFALDLIAGNGFLLGFVLLGFVVLGILSGILPLIKNAIGNIRSTVYESNGFPSKKNISKSLIVLQYTISIALIVAVLVIQRQTKFALNSSMGANTNNQICFENVHTNVQRKFKVMKEELLKHSSIEFVSAMLEPPAGEANDKFEFEMEGYVADETDYESNRIGIFPCDFSFANIFGLEFLAGSNFSEKNKDNEGSGEYIINHSAMRKLGYANPDKIIGKGFGLIVNYEGIEIPYGKIIGVVEDFHLSSIKRLVGPLVMFKRDELWLLNIVVSFKPGMRTQALSDIEAVWDQIYPEFPFQYEYVGYLYENVYKTEMLQAKLLAVFTFGALFICSMGLLGLSLLTTQRRIKEIGIRKANGAKTSQIISMLNRYFLKWVLISFVLATPTAYFAMDKWLENFAYKINLGWWMFALAGIMAILTALATVSLQSRKAAKRNPVGALRYE